MTRFSNLTSRNLLIAIHDALATTLAVLASFYLRFEGELLSDRLPLLLRILPYFIALSVIVCYVFNLTTTKWRFISLPDVFNILRTATVLTVALLAARLHFRRTERSWHLLPRQNHYRTLLVSRGVFPERIALCLSLFSLHTRAASCPNGGCRADTSNWSNRRCRSSFARN